MFQEDRASSEIEALPDNAVSVYFWSGENNKKKVDHVSLRTRGARGYDLKVNSHTQWSSLPIPINVDLNREEKQLRLVLRDRLINIMVVAQGICYRIDKANGEIIEGLIRDIDLELPGGSLTSYIEQHPIQTIKWKIINFIKNRHSDNIGEEGIYASFYPNTPTKTDTKPAKTKSFDLDKKDHKGKFREIIVYDLDPNKVEEKFQYFLEEGYAFSFFASTVFGARKTQNCTILAYNLLQAGGAGLPSMNMIPFDKKFIIYNVMVETALYILSINGQIHTLNNTKNTSYTLLGSLFNPYVFAVVYYKAIILEQFGLLWMKHIYNGKNEYHSLIFALYTIFRIMREREDNNAAIIISFIVSGLLFYLAQNFLYERTFSPRDLYEILWENQRPHGNMVEQHSNMPDIILSSENNWAILSKFLCGISGVIYAFVEAKRLHGDAYLSNFKFVTEFLLQLVASQYIHFNPDISFMAFLMGNPLISRLSGGNYMNYAISSGRLHLIESIQYVTGKLLRMPNFLWAALFANISLYFASQELNRHPRYSLIHQNETPSIWSAFKPLVILMSSNLVSATLLRNRPAYSGLIMGAALAYYKHMDNELMRPKEANQPQWNKAQMGTLLIYFLISNELIHQDQGIGAGIVMIAGLALAKEQTQTHSEVDREEEEAPRSTWSKANIVTTISVGAALIGAGFLAYKNSTAMYNAVSGITKCFGVGVGRVSN